MLGMFFAAILAVTGNTDVIAPECHNGLCWQISPVICITEQPGQPCLAVLDIQWRSNNPQDVCLYLAEQSLQCWQQASHGRWQQNWRWHSGLLTLRDNTLQPLLQAELQVLSRAPLRRRRVGAPWSIF